MAGDELADAREAMSGAGTGITCSRLAVNPIASARAARATDGYHARVTTTDVMPTQAPLLPSGASLPSAGSSRLRAGGV